MWTDNIFYIRYVPGTNTINCYLAETQSKSVSIIEELNPDICWHHVVFVREGTKARLYLNNVFVQELTSTSRVNVLNDGDLILGNSDCRSSNELPFSGLIDDLRFYNRAIDPLEIRDLYFSPDMIANTDTLLFLGNSVDLSLTETCGTGFNWSPLDGVSAPTSPDPTITPTQAGTLFYTVEIADNVSNCVAVDSIRITVVDPDDLDCDIAYLPKAFTPNDDGLNDTYGISNPFAIQELISFEIFDRWGSRVFFTESPFEQWDGTFNGEKLNPGVLLYKVQHVCNGEEILSAGSLTIMK